MGISYTFVLDHADANIGVVEVAFYAYDRAEMLAEFRKISQQVDEDLVELSVYNDDTCVREAHCYDDQYDQGWQPCVSPIGTDHDGVEFD